MTETPTKNTKNPPTFAAKIAVKAARKQKAQREDSHGLWFSLGMMGLIGWSVALPTLLGAALGLWLDGHHAGRQSWTLTLLVAGLILGCVNAWHWVSQEERAMHDEQNHDPQEPGDV